VARWLEKVADETTNAAAKELLRLISTFQARMKEKNPQKAKQKLRFVAGLKQVRQYAAINIFRYCPSSVRYVLQCINAVKAGKVRVLLLAPNTEANEVVDDKIDALIQEARRRDVPVCYCLSKRLLGKAVQLSMKQSAIAVLDPDGAYEFFKKIIRFINPSAT
jgi:ribosomal protein L7Ae-like RNA K-turn-binding protein